MPRSRTSDLAYLAGLAFGLFVMAAFGFFEYHQQVSSSTDFTYIWTGARTVVEGGDPYDPEPYLATAARYATARPHEPVYGYPPWVALGLAPLAALPLTVAAPIWTFGGMALAALSVRALLRAYAPGLPVVHTLAGIALFASQPGIATMWSGQGTFLVVAALAAALVALPEGGVLHRFGMAGLLLKPQLALFDLWALVRAGLARRGRAFAASVVGVLTLVVAIPWLIYPGWFEAWRTQLIPMRLSFVPPTTLATALFDLLGDAGAFLAVVALVAAVAAGLSFEPRGDAWLAVWVAISATFPAYAWSYDQLTLVVALVLTCGILARRSIRIATLAAFLGFAFFLFAPPLLYIIATLRMRESFNAFVPAVVLGLVLFALWPVRRSTR